MSERFTDTLQLFTHRFPWLIQTELFIEYFFSIIRYSSGVIPVYIHDRNIRLVCAETRNNGI